MGYLLGYELPYPDNVYVLSAWWLGIGTVLWLLAIVFMWRMGSRLSVALAGFVTPAAALGVVFSWISNLLLHTFTFSLEPPEAPRLFLWFVDGPVMRIWRTFTETVLSGIGLPCSLDPGRFPGSPYLLPPTGVLLVGLANEALLGSLCATASVLIVALALRYGRMIFRRH